MSIPTDATSASPEASNVASFGGGPSVDTALFRSHSQYNKVASSAFNKVADESNGHFAHYTDGLTDKEGRAIRSISFRNDGNQLGSRSTLEIYTDSAPLGQFYLKNTEHGAIEEHIRHGENDTYTIVHTTLGPNGSQVVARLTATPDSTQGTCLDEHGRPCSINSVKEPDGWTVRFDPGAEGLSTTSKVPDDAGLGLAYYGPYVSQAQSSSG